MNYFKKNVIQLTCLLFIYPHVQPIYKQENSFSADSILTIFNLVQKTKRYLLEDYKEQCNRYFKEVSCRNKIDTYLNIIVSGQLNSTLIDLNSPDLSIAEAAFSDLKKYWPWQREYTFLIPNLDNNIQESCFLNALDIDIMKSSEQDHITRKDYLAKYMDEKSLQKIQEYREHCISLQKEGDLNSLLNEVKHLRNRVSKNSKKTVLIDNICLAIVEKISESRITKSLHAIRYAPTLKESEQAVQEFNKYLEEELYPQLCLKNIIENV